MTAKLERSSGMLARYSSPTRSRALRLPAAVTAMAAILVSGCTTLGPNFMKPEAKVADKWREVSAEYIQASPVNYGNWWGTFNDPVLGWLVRRRQSAST